MIPRRMPLLLLLAGIAGSLLASLPTVKAQAKEPGDLWEVTTQMTMEGMPMALPSQKQRVCSAKEWKEPPGPQDEELKCRTLEFHNAGSKVTWKIQCDGPPAMTGEGEITRSGSDAYAGRMKLTSPEGVMTMKLDGRRVGDCDAADTKRQVAQVQAQAAQGQADAAAAQAQLCKSVVASMDLRSLQAMGALCTDPALKTDFCRRLETPEGFAIVATCANTSSDGLAEEAAYCGKDPKQLTQSVCGEAQKQESLDLLARCCPAEAQALAQRECAGRKYTELAGSKYQSFCSTYAKAGLEDGSQPAVAAPAESKTEKAKKTLKGLFKR